MSVEARSSGTQPDGFGEGSVAKGYEDGKDRRYKLLFAVNGGAFAIAKLLVGDAKAPGPVVGGLELYHLAVGMILFTTAMVVDIDAFGQKMRRKAPSLGLFGPVGVAVLFVLGALLVAGWALAGVPTCWREEARWLVWLTVGLAVWAHLLIASLYHWIVGPCVVEKGEAD